MTRPVEAGRKAMVTQITTLYNCSEQKSSMNLEVDALQQHKAVSGSTPVSQEQHSEAAVDTGSSKLDT